MFKRVSSIVLTVVMLISMLCTITVASAAPATLPQLVLSVDDTDSKVERGQVVTVTVGLSAAIDATAAEIAMPYNTDLFSAYEVIDAAEGETVSNLAGDDICFVWATAADAQPTAFFKVKFTVKSDAAFGMYDVDASIKDLFHGQGREAYVAGTDYVAVAEHLALEVYCEHDYQYAAPTGNPAQNAAQHTVTCSKCEKTPELQSCTFGAPSVVNPDTCTAVGVSKIECTSCHYAIEYDVDDIKDHKWSTKWYADTETEEDESRHYQKCENANCTSRNYADCTSLNWNTVKTENGSKHICADCGREMACIWQKYGTEHQATCTTNAYTTYNCIKLCGGYYNVIHANTATGHNIVKDPSGTTHSCSKCDEVKNVACTFNKPVQTGDSCTKDTIKACVCGNRKVIAAPGYHPEAKKVIKYKAPSERASGYIQLTCTACDAKLDYVMNKNLAKGKQFNDIDDWYKDTAIFAKSFNLMGGDGEGNFNGDGDLTRGMVVTVLGRYMWGYLEQMSEREFQALLNSLGGTPVELNDLKGDWYDRYAIALSTIGVVKGAYGNFNGDDNVTREELATFFVRYIDYIAPGTDATYGPSNQLSDMNTVSDWAKETAERAVRTGLIAGDEGKFNPQGTATRAQMATIMERIVRAHSEYPIVNA